MNKKHPPYAPVDYSAKEVCNYFVEVSFSNINFKKKKHYFFKF